MVCNICPQLIAGNRTELQMKEAAAQVLKTNLTRASDKDKLKEYLSMSKLKVYGYDNGGFAIVTNDDRYKEVIGYSTSCFTNDLPCGFKWWIETANNNMINKAEISSFFKSRKKTITKSPLLISSIWGQERPFNDYCTITYNNNNIQCVTGCIATALAQIMNYYKYPKCGTGSVSYDVNYNNSLINFSEDFSQSVYDWDNMLDSYDAYSKTSTEDVHTHAVAKLMKDCGLAVETQYNDKSHGSSAYIESAESALKEYFSYDNSTKLYKRSDYANNEWMKMIYDELDKGRPIIYVGMRSNTDMSGGHAFILHGYDSSGNVYINWGWDGRLDGYFDIDMLNPDKNSYNYKQKMLIAIPGNVSFSTHTLTISANGYGTVHLGSYNGTTIRESSQSFAIKDGNDALLLLTPDLGCKVKSLTINNKDVTSGIQNNEYRIQNIQADASVMIEFEKDISAFNAKYNTYITCLATSSSTSIYSSGVTKKIGFEISGVR